jgi:hypothetical protein
VVVPDALGRVEDVGLPVAQISSNVLNQVVEVGGVGLVGADVLSRVDGVELEHQRAFEAAKLARSTLERITRSNCPDMNLKASLRSGNAGHKETDPPNASSREVDVGRSRRAAMER